jgi:Sulfatase
MIHESPRTRLITRLTILVVVIGSLGWSALAAAEPTGPPNILFIILDDLGKDQLRIFNPLDPTAPRTPNIDAIAAAGVKFTNVTTMPECSPSRVTFFTGRYAFRTGVTAAILAEDLAGAQISPYEITTPNVLKTAGYTSAMIGKYHLGGPDLNPDTFRTPSVLGWDYFNGNLQGGPPFIDQSVGGQFETNTTTYSCGFPTGNQKGSCWFVDQGNKPRFDNNQGQGYTGKQCATLGGIPALDGKGDLTLTCSAQAACTVPDFTLLNGYYAWEQVINDGSGLHRSIVRQYMSSFQTDAAIDWIRKQSQGGRANRPWMATVSYDAIHTPYQPPPDDLYPPGFVWPPGIPQDCTSTEAVRILSNLMAEAMDKEIGRLLVSTGLARYGASGELIYDPLSTNTMIVIVGDNGTYLSGVKYPYNPLRAKGTPYETGVSAPLIVAGPQVVAPGRSVDAMVNGVDFFELFGEMAGVNVRSVVPSAHVLDSLPMRAYLTNPLQSPVRQLNFTQLGDGLKAPTTKLYPCVLQVGPSFVCPDILFTTEALCHQEGGTWYGPTETNPTPQYPTCCDIKIAQIPPYDGNLTIVPTQTWAMRNERYKYVRATRAMCDTANPNEFYDLAPRPLDPINPLGLDNGPDDLLNNPPLTPVEAANYQALTNALDQLLASEVSCPGDGNLDKRVDRRDFVGVRTNKGKSSVFDFNADGVTDDLDLQIVKDNFGAVCSQ